MQQSNSNAYQTVPVQVAEDVMSVSCGNSFTAILKNDGILWMAGDGRLGKLGNGRMEGKSNTWLRPSYLDTYVAVSCGNDHAMALLPDGTLQGWGENSSGALGTLDLGSKSINRITGVISYYKAYPSPVSSFDQVTAVSCGTGQTIAIQADGTVWVWGYNDSGLILGNGGQSNNLMDNSSLIEAYCPKIQTVPSKISGLKARQPGSFTPPPVSNIAPAAKKAFTDVPEGEFYTEAVKWAVEKEITSGTGATTFSPNQKCTKGQIITFLWRAKGEPAPSSLFFYFKDVQMGDYCYESTLWASENGMTPGIKFLGEFKPDLPCTRAQAMLYIWQAVGEPAPTTKAVFKDVPVNADYAQAVAWAVEKGITSGTSETTFSPNAICTRGQIVTFLYRAMGK